MISREELAAMRERCAKATAGPWHRVNGDDEHCMSAVGVATVAQDGEHDFFDMGSCPSHRQTVALTLWQSPRIVDHESSVWHDDADFIAHARTDLPRLLAEVERLRGVAEAAKARPWIIDSDGDGRRHCFGCNRMTRRVFDPGEKLFHFERCKFAKIDAALDAAEGGE